MLVKNKRTKIEHEITDAEWQAALENGLHKKFQVIENLKGENKKPIHFSPPELKNMVIKKKVAKEKTIAG